MSILLVEDNDFEATVFERVLRGCEVGQTLLRARCLGEASACLCDAENSPDVVFVDQHLPDGLGTDLAAEIKRASDGNRPIVFMLTCDVSDVTRAEALASQADGYLTKPVNASRLRAILEGRRRHWEIADLPHDLDIYRRRMGVA